MGRPGIMFYFSVRPCLNRLTTEEKGLLFEAMLDYGEHGVVPSFEGALGVAWDFVQLLVDKDEASYHRKLAQRRYAVYAREEKKAGREPVEYEKWISTDIEKHRSISDDEFRYPIPVPIPTPTSTSIPASETVQRPAPPTPAEVADFIRANRLPVDPQRFVSYYEVHGWPRDWKATCRRWSETERPKKTGQAGFAPGGTTQPSVERINRNAAELDAFLAEQGVEL